MLGHLLAYDMPNLDPLEVSAIAIVALVVRWFMARDNKTDDATLARIAALESKVDYLNGAMSKERSAKHHALAAAAAYSGTLRVVELFGKDCDCGTFARLEPLLAEALNPSKGVTA